MQDHQRGLWVAGGDWCSALSYSCGIVTCSLWSQDLCICHLATNLLPGYNTLFLISIGSNRTRVERLVSLDRGGRGGVLAWCHYFDRHHISLSVCLFEINPRSSSCVMAHQRELFKDFPPFSLMITQAEGKCNLSLSVHPCWPIRANLGDVDGEARTPPQLDDEYQLIQGQVAIFNVSSCRSHVCAFWAGADGQGNSSTGELDNIIRGLLRIGSDSSLSLKQRWPNWEEKRKDGSRSRGGSGSGDDCVTVDQRHSHVPLSLLLRNILLMADA